jgi:hypothetical protein
LDDPVKGELDDGPFGLAGDILEDVTDDVRSVTVRRGRSRELERYQAGAATVTLDNKDRKYDPAAGTAVTPYGASMRPRKAVQISTAGVPILAGVVDDWDLEYSLNGDHVASVKITDGFVFLANQEIEPHTATAQATGARVSAILDRSEIAWPAGKRDIDTGSATLQADDIGGSSDPKPVNALQYLQKVDEAEQGALFIGADGSVVFRGRAALQVLSDVVFADDGTGIPFYQCGRVLRVGRTAQPGHGVPAERWHGNRRGHRQHRGLWSHRLRDPRLIASRRHPSAVIG